MITETYAGRQLDPRTMTYAFSDGSGRITQEQIMERKALLTEIYCLENELAATEGSMVIDTDSMLMTPRERKVAYLGLLKLRYLTYFSEPTPSLERG